jgi:hypothetical protein
MAVRARSSEYHELLFEYVSLGVSSPGWPGSEYVGIVLTPLVTICAEPANAL